jgi:hypothetical protein
VVVRCGGHFLVSNMTMQIHSLTPQEGIDLFWAAFVLKDAPFSVVVDHSSGHERSACLYDNDGAGCAIGIGLDQPTARMLEDVLDSKSYAFLTKDDDTTAQRMLLARYPVEHRFVWSFLQSVHDSLAMKVAEYPLSVGVRIKGSGETCVGEVYVGEVPPSSEHGWDVQVCNDRTEAMDFCLQVLVNAKKYPELEHPKHRDIDADQLFPKPGFFHTPMSLAP